MGVIVVGPEARRVTLDARTVIGRSSACAVRTDDARVSGEHASIWWHAGAWCVRDLGSTNGTWLGETRLASGKRLALASGAELFLGAPDGFRVVLADASSPAARAVDVATGVVRVATHELLHLPDDDAPEATVLHDLAWHLERDGELADVADQDVVEIAGTRWRLELPARAPDAGLGTTEPPGDDATRLESCSLRFQVSADEEYIELTVLDARRALEVPPRGFHYMLLTLARLRLRDEARGLPPSEQGWVYADELVRMLGASRVQLNLDVCRARQRFAAVGVLGASRLVERRRSSNQLRIGVSALDVRSLDCTRAQARRDVG